MVSNGRVIRPTKQVRMTVVRVAIPFWRRLFAGELVLGILGTVEDVALLTRDQAQEMLTAGYQSKWVPYQDAQAVDPTPTKGPNLT